MYNRSTFDEFQISEKLLPRYEAYARRFPINDVESLNTEDSLNDTQILFSHSALLPPNIRAMQLPAQLPSDDTVTRNPFDDSSDCSDEPDEAVNVNNDDFDSYFLTQGPALDWASRGTAEASFLKKLQSETFVYEKNSLINDETMQHILRHMSDRTVLQVVKILSKQAAPRQNRDKFVEVVATELILPRLVNNVGRISRLLAPALSRYVAKFPRSASSELLPQLVVAAPNNVYLAHLVQQSVNLLQTPADKNTLMWLALKEIDYLHRAHLPLILPLVQEGGEMRSTQLLMRLMIESRNRFRVDVTFGRLLVAMLRITTPEQHDALRLLVLRHKTSVAELAEVLVPEEEDSESEEVSQLSQEACDVDESDEEMDCSLEQES